MKQKIIIKVQIACYKCRTKALKIAAGASGVISVTAQGDDHLVVTGMCVDPVALTATLRKKVGVAILISVEELKDPKKDAPPPAAKEVVPAEDRKSKGEGGGGEKPAKGNGKGKGNGNGKEKPDEKEKPSSPTHPPPHCCSYGYGMPPPCGPCPPPYYNYPQPQYCMYEIPPPDANCSIM